MHTTHPCPSCQTFLKIPLDRGILFIRCPVCNYSFRFDPAEEIFQNPSLKSGGDFFLFRNPWRQRSAPTAPKEESPFIYSSGKKDLPYSADTSPLIEKALFDKNQMIVIVLFFILGLYTLRGTLNCLRQEPFVPPFSSPSEIHPPPPAEDWEEWDPKQEEIPPSPSFENKPVPYSI